jgi:hypothetical protein
MPECNPYHSHDGNGSAQEGEATFQKKIELINDIPPRIYYINKIVDKLIAETLIQRLPRR